MSPTTTFELLDAGDGRRLERFGDRVLDRPAPGANKPRRSPAAWAASDLRFEPGHGWAGRMPLEPWTVVIDGLTMELRPMPSGGIGLFPEQLANLAWLEARTRGRADGMAGGASPPRVLNLFAHTGLLTLAVARAGAAVVHVDASRPAMAWARRNAELSGLADRPIRWLLDDVSAYVAREGRRRHRYDGLIVDPPSYGRSGSRRWRLLDDLPELFESCAAILADDAFVLLTAHTTGVDGRQLLDLAATALGRPDAEAAPLALDAASGARLELGWAVRIT